MTDFFDFIIIGAGIAGVKAAEGIRSLDNTASILVINGEDDLPYKRTRLSKTISKNFDPSAFSIHPAGWYQTLNIRLVNDIVLAVGLETKTIKTVRQGITGFGKLIFASGSRPCPLKLRGDAREDVNYLRNAADVRNLLAVAENASKILIVGGGVLGVEMAASMIALGKSVTLVHSDTSLVNHHFDDYFSSQIYTLLQSNGVQIILHERLKSLTKTGSTKILAEVGEMIHMLCDLVIVTAGVEPETELAKAAGIRCEKGILVNDLLVTSHPDVFAAGDVAQTSFGEPSGLWHEAEYQGWTAGRNAAGDRMLLSNKTFRLKMEVFGQYFFSMNFGKVATDRENLLFEHDSKKWRFMFSEEKLTAALMINDSGNAKLIEQAVNEGWTREKIAGILEPYRISG